MEAARLASLRGYAVTLMEASDRLGGRFALAAETAEPNAELLAWLVGEMARRDIDVRLGERAEAEAIVEAGYDEVILATGAAWPRPEWGDGDARVATVDDLSDWLTDEGDERGRHVVVVGGNKAGLGLASVARRRGASVEVLEESEVFGAAVGLVGRWRYVHEAREAGIVLEAGARVAGLDVEGLRWTAGDGSERVSAADFVFVAQGARPGSRLAAALRTTGVVGRMIGDAKEVRFVEGAMESAAELVLGL